jgi:glycosyltransferase 2 family protein
VKPKPKAKTNKATEDRPLKVNYQIVASILLFIVAMKLSRNPKMDMWEEATFRAIYNLPDWMNIFFLSITQLGNIFVLFGLSVIYLARKRYHIVIRLLMSGFLAYLITGVAKDLFGRGRPQELLVDIVYRDLLIRGPGFPSGHAALATAVALTLWRHLPKRHRWVVPFIIIGVSMSRIYLGVHAPLDVIGGIAIGWFSAEIFRFVQIRDIRKSA